MQFLIHAERCIPAHIMLDGAYGMLKDHFHTETEQAATSSPISLLTTTPENFPPQDNESKFDIILKTVLKKLVSLLSNNSFALKRLEDILNQRNKDTLLALYLERTLFQNSPETENILIFFKLATLPFQNINKSRKIQITPEQYQELENLISLNQQHHGARESITKLIDEFNKGNITKENLFKKLQSSIKEGSADYLFLEEKTACSTPRSF